ncbi:IS200/IS605 family transposase [Streptomyces hokutonensis]|uniref:IS200/IS605 family transposase n=1 Tax=Streptomyces hokutonensis TaxID=1306990 RepID=UPI0036C37B6C
MTYGPAPRPPGRCRPALRPPCPRPTRRAWRTRPVRGSGRRRGVRGWRSQSFGAEPAEFNGEGDHTHLLAHYPPKIALSKLVNSLKGVSSRCLRAEYTGRINRIGTGSAFWAPSYFVGSCGGAPLSIVKDYVENQKRPA